MQPSSAPPSTPPPADAGRRAEERITDLADRLAPEQMLAAGFALAPQRVGLIGSNDPDEDPALHIHLVFADDTPPESLRWDAIQPLVEWVLDQSEAITPERRPRVRVLRHKEWMGT